MMTGSRGRLSRVLAAALALVAAAAAPACAETVLRLSNWVPPSHPLSRDVLVPWADDVARATEGRVRVESLASPLGKPPAHFDIARDGLADIAVGVHGYTPGRFVLTEVAELPFLSDSAETLSVAFWRVHARYLARAGEHKGVHVVGLWTHGPGHIFNARREVAAIGDLAGLKFRVGGGLVSQIADALGTVAVQAPATQSYELLVNGVADGIFFPTESIAFFNLAEIMRFATLVPGGLYNSTFFLVINQNRWDALDAADQAAIMAVSGEALARRAGRAWDAADRAGLETLTGAGARLDVADARMLNALQARLAFVRRDWVDRATDRGVDGAVALSALEAEIAAVQ